MPQHMVYEEPIKPIFIDHEKAVQAYYSIVEKIALETPQDPYYPAPAPQLPYPDTGQYPAANYPQSNLGMPGYDPQFNPNPYGYQNPYYGQPAAPYYNAASYSYPYQPGTYPQPQYGVTSNYPSPAYPPQPAPNQWSGQPLPPTGSTYPYQDVSPGMQHNTVSYRWSDLGVLLPSAPQHVETHPYQGHAKTSRSYITEETIHAANVQRNFSENSSLIHTMEYGWKI